MNITKKIIVSNASKKSLIPLSESSHVVQSFLDIIKCKAKSNTVKISGFGIFSFKKTLKRLGRNPKTKESYIIKEQNKFNFKPSSKIKRIIN
ncbi:HU family DNA-binding protein [Gammaproteobacteria bacterium]|nr:HU family DNA-binding protein [Gammaproteobacteria bacterium]